MAGRERRRALRLKVTLPAVYTVLPPKEVDVPPDLAKVYERVYPNADLADQTFQGVIRDLSASGAFVTGTAPPLLSRLLLQFPLPGIEQVEAVGWVLWRRKEDCSVTRPSGEQVTLRAGFGVVFEAMSTRIRRHIDRLAHMNAAAEALLSPGMDL